MRIGNITYNHKKTKMDKTIKKKKLDMWHHIMKVFTNLLVLKHSLAYKTNETFFFPCSRESLVWWEFDKSCDIVFYSHYFGGVVFFFIIFGWCHIFLIFGRHFIFLIIFGRGHIFLSQNLDYVICSLMLGGCLIFLFGDVIFPLIIFGGRHAFLS